MADLAKLPLFEANIDEVTFISEGTGSESSNHDIFGGFLTQTATGGLFVQAPSLTVPMLWNRGTMYNLGMFGSVAQGATIPAVGSADFLAGPDGIWWDSPRSWGRAGFLIRRPKILIILDALGVAESWVNANYASLAALNVSVVVFQSRWGASWIAAGIPFSFSNNITSTSALSLNPDAVFQYSLPETDTSQYVGGMCFVAHLQNDFFGSAGAFSAIGNTTAYVGNYGATPPSTIQTVMPLTKYEATDGATPANTIGCYVNSPKASNDIGLLVAGAAKFKAFQTILYQYNQNPTTSANLVANAGVTGPVSPSPIIPDSVADSLLTGGSGVISRKTFNVNDSTSMLAQLLTDALAFFA